MLSLRRILFASLLTGLVFGCKPKSEPVRPEDAKPATALEKKLKQAQEQPEGPRLRP